MMCWRLTRWAQRNRDVPMKALRLWLNIHHPLRARSRAMHTTPKENQ
jgi:hypothetical protein